MTLSVTQREHDIWLMVAGGMHRREIASALGIHESTLSNHVENLYRKIDAHSPRDALHRAVAYGVFAVERLGEIAITNTERKGHVIARRS
jgi:DNA-binding CsgD family transcriptional regulator